MASWELQNSQGNIIQTNIGDSAGNLWASRNIDLTTKPGKVKLSRPFAVHPISTAPSNFFDDPVQALTILKTTETVQGTAVRLFALSLSQGLYYRNYDGSGGTNIDPITGANEAQDMVVYNGGLAIAYEDDIALMDNEHNFEDDWWTDEGGSALDEDYPHILQVHRSGQETISVTDGPTLRYYNATANFTSLALHNGMVACCQASGIGRGWVGTYTTSSDEALVYEWSIGNDQVTRSYPTGAKAVLAMEVVDDTPYIITERGEIKMFNNVGFTTVATLPIYYQPTFFSGVDTAGIESFNTNRPIHPKGMKRFHDSILIYVNADLNTTGAGRDSRMASGIWEFNTITKSLHHRHAIEGDVMVGASSPLLISNEEKGRIWCGGSQVDPGTGDAFNGVWYEDLEDVGENSGWYVSPELYSSSVQDAFNEVVTKADIKADQRIVLKYRTETHPVSRLAGSWLSNKTFNTTNDASEVLARFQSGQKDEATIILGTNAGKVAHITNIEQSSTVYSITLDEAIGTAGEDVWLDFENWTKVNDEYTSGSFQRLGLDVVSPRVQIKTYIEGSNGYPEIYGQTTNSQSKNQKR